MGRRPPPSARGKDLSRGEETGCLREDSVSKKEASPVTLTLTQNHALILPSRLAMPYSDAGLVSTTRTDFFAGSEEPSRSCKSCTRILESARPEEEEAR